MMAIMNQNLNLIINAQVARKEGSIRINYIGNAKTARQYFARNVNLPNSV